MAINIHKEKPLREFSILSNQIIQRPDLSFAARGLLAYLLSLPDEWEIRLDALKQNGDIGLHALRKMIHELEAAGFMSLTTNPRICGEFTGKTWKVYANPAMNPGPFRNCTVQKPTGVYKDISGDKDIPEEKNKSKESAPSALPSSNEMMIIKDNGTQPTSKGSQLIKNNSGPPEAEPTPIPKPPLKPLLLDVDKIPEQGVYIAVWNETANTMAYTPIGTTELQKTNGSAACVEGQKRNGFELPSTLSPCFRNLGGKLRRRMLNQPKKDTPISIIIEAWGEELSAELSQLLTGIRSKESTASMWLLENRKITWAGTVTIADYTAGTSHSSMSTVSIQGLMVGHIFQKTSKSSARTATVAKAVNCQIGTNNRLPLNRRRPKSRKEFMDFCEKMLEHSTEFGRHEKLYEDMEANGWTKNGESIISWRAFTLGMERRIEKDRTGGRA